MILGRGGNALSQRPEGMEHKAYEDGGKRHLWNPGSDRDERIPAPLSNQGNPMAKTIAARERIGYLSPPEPIDDLVPSAHPISPSAERR